MSALIVLRALAVWLTAKPERKDDAEQTYRDAIAAGDPEALRALTDWLATIPGREIDVEQLAQFGLDIHDVSGITTGSRRAPG